MTQRYGDGFKRPIDFYTGKPDLARNPQATYGRYGQGAGIGRVEILPENTPRREDPPKNAKVSDVDNDPMDRTVNYG